MPAKYTHAARRGILRTGPPRAARRPSAFAGGPDVETAVRKTGLLTAGRNPGVRTGPVRQLLTTGGNNVPFEG